VLGDLVRRIRRAWAALAKFLKTEFSPQLNAIVHSQPAAIAAAGPTDPRTAVTMEDGPAPDQERSMRRRPLRGRGERSREG